MEKENERLVYIPVGNISEHPKNPRKDVGDVSELAQSIRENGVLQNLTVVPYWSPVHQRIMEGLYTVIIGHRRLAACKLAGVKEVPCIIADMTPEQQFRTMMIENMQRSDLTVLEEADGFQLMLDMGDTVADISEQTGISETTIRRRISIAKLDRKAVIKGQERGATMADYLELDKIKSPERKNEVLKTIGTSNFRQRVKSALEDEAAERYLADIAKKLEASDWAVEVKREDRDRDEMRFMHNYNRWNKRAYEKPKDADEKIYYYVVCEDEIDLYVQRDDKPEISKEAELRLKYQHLIGDQCDELLRMGQECRSLREEFVYKFTAYSTYEDEIMALASRALLECMERMREYVATRIDMEELCTALSVRLDKKYNLPDKGQFYAASVAEAGRTLLYTAYLAMEYKDNKPYYTTFDSKIGTYVPVPVKDGNDRLKDLYRLLGELGYDESDEERTYAEGRSPQYAEVKRLQEEYERVSKNEN